MFKMSAFSYDARTQCQILVNIIWLSHGTVATFYRWGGHIYNQLMWRFFGIPYTKNY